ncbi:protein GAMETOPHYTE DEFECTIVE 1-like [Impatiens glandulifera]|uniref:protein GAMETOPHYTE DEFECTIVE 1-like n=1 Tax=Impatiens glandulifera TaxID=253017 RepID=UPI001FB0BF9B|nr:protein GAMETOPHYTE DEFECTIVE 1-like [Impatiens glandulifera]
MEFFDMNVPYYESDRNISDKDKASRKATRLKLLVKAIELGYGGLAYNRVLKGVMSDLDRCSIPLFPFSSLTKISPSISSSVKLHRQVLGLPLSAPFRQFTRLTVIVESSSQALSLNSGNPILKSYDIVAVRPMNQSAFEQACQTSEVDMISIHFSDKMPFRLKHPMVKAAIQRGVYFEITYSGLITDAQTRRQLISNAKLLVDWTRGKNLIISSAAPSVSEMRGPYDIANLTSLLGLPMERAKAALSKNCRALLTHAVRRKHYYKEAVRVELIPSTGNSDETKEKLLNDWLLNWDPISSGDGDLLLDEMKNSVSASNLVSKTVKAIDFASVMNSIASAAEEAVKHPYTVSEETNRDGLNSKPIDCANHLTDVENTNVLEDTKIPDASLVLEDDKMEEDLILTVSSGPSILESSDYHTLKKHVNVEGEEQGMETTEFKGEEQGMETTESKGEEQRMEITESKGEEQGMEITESKGKEQGMEITESKGEEQGMEITESKEMDMVVMGELTYDKDDDLVNTDLATQEQKKIENQAETSCTVTFDKFPGKIILKPRKRHRGFLFPLRRLLTPINFKRKAKKSKAVIQLM